MDIDLPPKDWVSEREKPREPFFGKAAGPLLGNLVVLASSLGLIVLVACAGIYAKKTVSELMFGSPPRPDYQWTPERGLVRLR